MARKINKETTSQSLSWSGIEIAGPGAEAATLSIGGIKSLGGTVQLLSGGDLTASSVMIGLGGTLEFSGGGNTGGNLHANTIVDDGIYCSMGSWTTLSLHLSADPAL